MSAGSTLRKKVERARDLKPKATGGTSKLDKFKAWLEKKSKRKMASNSRKVNRKGK